jgi:demethylmenaquinone methyltransferase / 2-methoxy-6-polyprenyl-1,4-benzoquinol methylase
MSSQQIVKSKEEVRGMFDRIASTYDKANDLISLSLHRGWKKKLVHYFPNENEIVLDLCTGTGDLIPLLEKKSRAVIAGDFSEGMLEVAKKRFPLIAPSYYVVCDAMNLDFKNESFDAVSVSFGVRNFEHLERGLTEIHRVLKKDGVLGILESGQPGSKLLKLLYSFYSRFFLSFVGRLISGDKYAYTYFPESAKEFPFGEAFTAHLKKTGFIIEKNQSLLGGLAYIYIARKK